MPHRLAMVRSVAARLATARTVREVADATLNAANEYLQAATASLWLITEERDTLELRYEYNAMPGAVARFARVPLSATDIPGPHVVATGDACFVASLAERDQLWPAVAGTPTKSEALAVLPMTVGDRSLGVVSFGFSTPGAFDEESRLALLAIADQCAIALDRAQLHEAMSERAHGQSLLARVSAMSPTSQWVDIARHGVEECVREGLADFCAVYIREGHLVRRAAVACASYPELAELIVDHFPTPLSSDASNATVIRTGRAIAVDPERRLIPHSGSPMAAYADAMSDVQMGRGWTFPLTDRGTTFGSMMFLAPHNSSLSDEAADLARAVSERLASVMASAAAFAEQQAALHALHDIVLPGHVGDLPGVELAARYVPVARNGAVGGDWWDALTLPDGAVGLAIGDVAGHGIPASTVMGQLRNALRIQLVNGATPAASLGALSSFLDWTFPEAHSTALTARFNPDDGQLLWANAGHPPPLRLHADGTTSFLDAAPAAAIGVRGRRIGDYVDHSETLSVGDTIVLCTDGLIEGRHRAIDDGLATLDALVRDAGPELPLEELADRVLAQLVDRPEDDVCLLAIRFVGAGA